MAKACSLCGGASHSAMTCFLKPRKPMRTKTQLKPKKKMKKIGRIGQRLQDQRVQYFIDNPPPYYCIYCRYCDIDVPILEEDAQIEHGMTKNNNPGLRFSKGNLYISCSYHNEQKGDKDIDEYLEELDRQRHAAQI